jgi:hypothetical protein
MGVKTKSLWGLILVIMVWTFISASRIPGVINYPVLQSTPSPTEPLIGFYPFPSDINPLTGLKPEDPARLNRRPVMVKISNYPPGVRPQSGLSFADIVFEYYIGEGTNRFLALYYGQDAIRAGSIRSGRLVDSQLVPMYQGILVYGSADPRVDQVIEERLKDRAISHLEVGCPVICGAKDTHISPWIYADTAAVSRYSDQTAIENARHNLDGMLFDPKPPSSDQFVIKLGTEYSSFDRGEWRYNPQSGLYERWQETDLSKKNMSLQVDRINNQKIEYANVIIIFAKYIEYNPTLHDIEIWKNTQGQPAMFFRDGMMMEGSWQVQSPEKPIQFYNQKGLPYALKPGKTWIMIAGNSSSLKQIKPGEWDLYFDLP